VGLHLQHSGCDGDLVALALLGLEQLVERLDGSHLDARVERPDGVLGCCQVGH